MCDDYWDINDAKVCNGGWVGEKGEYSTEGREREIKGTRGRELSDKAIYCIMKEIACL